MNKSCAPDTGTDNDNNIWNGKDFKSTAAGNKVKPIAWFKHFWKCLKWSWQRIVRGYSDRDLWDIGSYLQKLLPSMLETYKRNRMGSPGYLGKGDDENSPDYVSCHEEWDQILDKMIFLWRESSEDTCSRKNEYEDEHLKAFCEFSDKYGVFGSKLQTREELEREQDRGYSTVHFMSELPEYKEIDQKYREREEELEIYRKNCMEKAMDMIKEYYYDLWD